MVFRDCAKEVFSSVEIACGPSRGTHFDGYFMGRVPAYGGSGAPEFGLASRRNGLSGRHYGPAELSADWTSAAFYALACTDAVFEEHGQIKCTCGGRHRRR